MNMVDRLLKADVVNKLAERPEKKVKMERLSKLFGFDFIITLRAIDPERYADIQKMAVDFTNGSADNIDIYQMHSADHRTQRLYDPGKGGQSRKKLIRTDGEVQAMYLLFREHHLLPSAVMKLGYGERQVLYAFIRYEMEERDKKVSSALSD